MNEDKNVYDFTEKVKMERGDICYVKLPPKTLENEYWADSLLLGSRPCIVLSIQGCRAYVLPFTHSEYHNISGFVFKLDPRDKLSSYPRFDLIMSVDVRKLYDHKFNFIYKYGEDEFKKIFTFAFAVINGSIDIGSLLSKNKTIINYEKDAQETDNQIYEDVINDNPVVEEEINKDILNEEKTNKDPSVKVPPRKNNKVAKIFMTYPMSEISNVLENLTYDEIAEYFSLSRTSVYRLKSEYATLNS